MWSKLLKFQWPLEKDMASPSASLFDIIITFIVVVIIIFIGISKIIIKINAIGVSYLSRPLLMTVPCQTHNHE